MSWLTKLFKMNTYTILIPHYKTGKMTAYCISQIIKHSKDRQLEIVIVDNNSGDGSLDRVRAVCKELPGNLAVTFIAYPKELLQSHGCAFDFALKNGWVHNEYFITLEGDSFPVEDHWLEWYDEVIKNGGNCTGSILK